MPEPPTPKWPWADAIIEPAILLILGVFLFSEEPKVASALFALAVAFFLARVLIRRGQQELYKKFTDAIRHVTNPEFVKTINELTKTVEACSSAYDGMHRIALDTQASICKVEKDIFKNAHVLEPKAILSNCNQGLLRAFFEKELGGLQNHVKDFSIEKPLTYDTDNLYRMINFCVDKFERTMYSLDRLIYR